MADNLNVTAGSGSVIGMDEVVDGTLGTVKVGFGKIMDGTLDSTNKLVVNASGEALVKPTANSQVDVNKIAGTTVDVNSGVKSAGTQRVVIATDQPALTNALKVDGSAVTQPVSGTVTATGPLTDTQLRASAVPVSLTSTTVTGTVTVDSELTTADLDTGAGTDTRAVVGLVGSKSGGGVLIPGDATKGLAVDLTATGANATALKVDGSAVTQPVSGTFWQATQPVSGTVTANAGTGTMAVSAASLPLPSGAATAAKQPALGTAGSASNDVLSVQGIASMTALKVDGSAVTQPVSGTVAATQSGTWNVGLSKTGTGYSVSSQTALTTTATVSSAAGKFAACMFINLNSAPAYIQVFDTTGAVTLGTTTPTFVIPIPANATAANGVAFVLPMEIGLAMANGIKVAATTTATGSTTVSTGLCGWVAYA